MPVATPKDIVDKLGTAVDKALKDRALKERFEKLAVEIGSVQEGQTLQQRIATELARWKGVVREAGIKRAVSPLILRGRLRHDGLEAAR